HRPEVRPLMLLVGWATLPFRSGVQRRARAALGAPQATRVGLPMCQDRAKLTERLAIQLPQIPQQMRQREPERLGSPSALHRKGLLRSALPSINPRGVRAATPERNLQSEEHTSAL